MGFPPRQGLYDPANEHDSCGVGFVGAYFVRSLAPGVYRPAVYRRAGAGWITCKGDQQLVAP